MKYIGWTKGNTVNFITATTLARHLIRTSGFKPKPFTFGSSTLVKQVKKHSPCYIIGSFEGGEIDSLIELGVNVAVIGKIHDRKYNIDRKQRIKNVVVYPVPKSNRYRGLEYLAALVTYFDVSNEEVRFFESLLSRKDALAKVLTVTNAWIAAYDVFTTFEVIDDSTPSDVDRVVEYLKKEYDFDKKYAVAAETVKNSVVLDRGGIVAVDVGTNDPRNYMVVAQETYQDKRAVVLVSRIPTSNLYKILVICNKGCSNEIKQKIEKATGAECRGGSRRFTVRVSMMNDLANVLEAIANALA